MDARLAELKRAYIAGDASVADALFRTTIRSQSMRNVDVELLALLGLESARLYFLSQEHNYGVRTLNNVQLWRNLGKSITLQLMVAGFIQPFRFIFDRFPEWCELARSYKPEYWVSRENCEVFKEETELRLEALQAWNGHRLPPVALFRTGDVDDRWDWLCHRLQQSDTTTGVHSKDYMLMWTLQNFDRKLYSIRTRMKRSHKKYVDNSMTWIHDLRGYWLQQLTGFTAFTLSPQQRPTYDEAQEALKAYLLPKAIELVLL